AAHGGDGMQIIDAQMHDVAPGLDWTERDGHARHDILTELMLAYLDAVGVAGALIVRRDREWAAVAPTPVPDPLASIAHVTLHVPDIGAYVADAKAKRPQGLLALRATIAWPPEESSVEPVRAGLWDPAFAACEKHGVPLFVMLCGWVGLAAQVAEEHPD